MIAFKIMGAFFFIYGAYSLYNLHSGFDPWAGYTGRHMLIDLVSLFLVCFGIFMMME
jgi:hypothetical protein